MTINAIYCKHCHNIIFSRSNHDFRSCDCEKCAVDSGLELFKISAPTDNDFVVLHLDSDVMLKQQMEYDYRYKNSNASNFPEGYLGKYKLTEHSNIDWFRKLIINFDDLDEELDKWNYKYVAWKNKNKGLLVK